MKRLLIIGSVTALLVASFAPTALARVPKDGTYRVKGPGFMARVYSLGLWPAQVRRIEALKVAKHDKIAPLRSMLEAGYGNAALLKQKIRNVRKNFRLAVLRVLTPAQRAALTGVPVVTPTYLTPKVVYPGPWYWKPGPKKVRKGYYGKPAPKKSHKGHYGKPAPKKSHKGHYGKPGPKKGRGRS